MASMSGKSASFSMRRGSETDRYRAIAGCADRTSNDALIHLSPGPRWESTYARMTSATAGESASAREQ